MIIYVLGALVVGAVIGAGISELRWRHRTVTREEEGGEPEPVSPALEEPVASAAPQAEVTTNLLVAEAVLDVADRLASQELCRRLGDALRPLEGLLILTPEMGDDFDSQVHDWVSTRPANPGQSPGTIAAIKVPGITSSDGIILRKARVVVFE
jgi:hypothetical protein